MNWTTKTLKAVFRWMNDFCLSGAAWIQSTTCKRHLLLLYFCRGNSVLFVARDKRQTSDGNFWFERDEERENDNFERSIERWCSLLWFNGIAVNSSPWFFKKINQVCYALTLSWLRNYSSNWFLFFTFLYFILLTVFVHDFILFCRE